MTNGIYMALQIIEFQKEVMQNYFRQSYPKKLLKI